MTLWSVVLDLGLFMVCSDCSIDNHYGRSLKALYIIEQFQLNRPYRQSTLISSLIASKFRNCCRFVTKPNCFEPFPLSSSGGMCRFILSIVVAMVTLLPLCTTSYCYHYQCCTWHFSMANLSSKCCWEKYDWITMLLSFVFSQIRLSLYFE